VTDIFVFGSNLRGIHGAGAARYAVLHHGAIYRQGIGLQGCSYGIPTKDRELQTLPLEHVEMEVAVFIAFARLHPELTFNITPIGCGLDGFKRSQIEPLFATIPSNCRFAKTWNDYHD